MGAPFMVKLSDEDLKRIGYNTVEIAKIEFSQGLIPIQIKKRFPGTIKRSSAHKAFDQTRLE